MPVKYICRNCGFVLWEFQRVGQDYFGVPTPEEIKRIYGVCPRCKSELGVPQLNDIVVEVIRRYIPISEIERVMEREVTEITSIERPELMAAQEA